MLQQQLRQHQWKAFLRNPMFERKLGNMPVITMITMFIPVILALLLKSLFGKTTANSFMPITGLTFTISSKYWLARTYNRFLKRKYKNMEGFKSN